MKTKIIIFSGLICLMYSCFTDKGNYDYHDINEIKIEGIAKSYSVVTDIDTLVIDPVITMTDGSPTDNERFEYAWTIVKGYTNKDTICKTRKLVYPVSMATGTFDFYLKIRDKVTDILFMQKSSITVGTAYTRGILLIGENKQGFAQGQMLAMVNDTIFFPDLLKNSGLPQLTGPVDILHTGDSYPKIWVLTKSGSYYLDITDMKVTPTSTFRNSVVASETLPDDLNPVDVVPRIKDNAGKNASTLYRAAVCSNGMVFFAITALFGGDYYTNPVNREALNYNKLLKAKPYIFCGLTAFSGILWYDEENERFMKVSGTDVASTALIDAGTDIFPWNQKASGRTLVYGENSLNVDGGSSGGNSYAIMKDAAGQSFIYKFYVSSTFQKRGFYQVKSIATGFLDAKFYAFSSKRTVVFYVYGNDLYAYDYNPGNEKCFKIAGFGTEEISMLKFDTQIEPATNPLYVATYNSTTGGTLRKYTIDTNPNAVTITADPKSNWGGLVKIVKMSWRGKK